MFKSNIVLQIDEQEQNLLVSALNDKRNQLIEHGCNDEQVDSLLLKIINAPRKKDHRREMVI